MGTARNHSNPLAAQREKYSGLTCQSGGFSVDAERLRFDFNHFRL